MISNYKACWYCPICIWNRYTCYCIVVGMLIYFNYNLFLLIHVLFIYPDEAILVKYDIKSLHQRFSNKLFHCTQQGEKECSFYMRTGSYKYGQGCRFHHPDPTAAGGGDTTWPGRRSSSARTINETATPFRPITYRPTSFRPVIYPPTQPTPENAKWNG